LRYAPIAALSAVIIPEIVMKNGALIADWRDARIYAAAVGAAFYVWRRGQGQAVLGTILVGMTVYLPLHIGLGW
jgi:branched-subunit amino acid transport protein